MNQNFQTIFILSICLFIKITVPVFAQGQEITLSRTSPYEFVPEGYRLHDVMYGMRSEIWGDLNKDGIDDCVLIIKATDPTRIFYDEIRGERDRNRRGIIITFKNGKNFELVLINTNCFASDQEDGGIYFYPILDIIISSGNLVFIYDHGRYGSWQYIFRFQNNDFELIGYDTKKSLSINLHPIERSINFLTERMKITTYPDFNENNRRIHWENIRVDNFYRLSTAIIEGLNCDYFSEDEINISIPYYVRTYLEQYIF